MTENVIFYNSTRCMDNKLNDLLINASCNCKILIEIDVNVNCFFTRRMLGLHKAFCVDIGEGTFSVLRSFLERYCQGFTANQPPPPFNSTQLVQA